MMQKRISLTKREIISLDIWLTHSAHELDRRAEKVKRPDYKESYHEAAELIRKLRKQVVD